MPQPIRQIVPGVLHWSVFHPKIDVDVSSYLVTASRVAIDPMLPAEGVEWFAEQDLEPAAVVLTNRHHLRGAPQIAARYGCPILVSRPGLHEFDGGQEVQAFDFGDDLPGGLVAHEVGAICPDETAVEIPEVKALAVADGVINYGELSFVPDQLMDEPGQTRRRLAEAYARLADDVDFEHLLLAHGEPVVLNGRAALRHWARQEKP